MMEKMEGSIAKAFKEELENPQRVSIMGLVSNLSLSLKYIESYLFTFLQ